MEYFYLAAGLILLLAKSFAPEVLKFDKEYYLNICKCLCIGFAASIVVNVAIGRFPPLPHNLGFGLFAVGWEDCVFSLLPIYLSHKFLPKWAAWTTTVIASLLFGLGHIYQSYLWGFITCFYPYFFSYRVGKEKGYLTVIGCHVTYDVFVSGIVLLLHNIGARYATV
jgi:membrane protease YdiL (CAAX protease family)